MGKVYNEEQRLGEEMDAARDVSTSSGRVCCTDSLRFAKRLARSNICHRRSSAWAQNSSFASTGSGYMGSLGLGTPDSGMWRRLIPPLLQQILHCPTPMGPISAGSDQCDRR